MSCYLKDPKWNQCCCNCIYLIPIHEHCKGKKSKKDPRKCACADRVGFACGGFLPERAFYPHPKHSVGCEMYTAKVKHERKTTN